VTAKFSAVTEHRAASFVTAELLVKLYKSLRLPVP